MKILEIYSDIESAPVEIRLSRAQAADTPPEVLKNLSRDPFWFVRDRVASNCITPPQILQELMLDPDFRVRAEAERNLFRHLCSDINPSLQTQIEIASQKRQDSGSNPTEKEPSR